MELQNYLPLFGVLALLFVFYKNAWVSKQDPGNEKMQIIAANISKGAMAFLKAEYKVLAIFVVAVAVLLAFKGANETEEYVKTEAKDAICATEAITAKAGSLAQDVQNMEEWDGKEGTCVGNYNFTAAVAEEKDLRSTSHWMVALSFVVGAICSGLAGFIGMMVATKANVRTTNAAQDSLGKGLGCFFWRFCNGAWSCWSGSSWIILFIFIL